MKIGDEIYVHGYIDEIRKDTIIIRNEGGYFGTVEKEICVGDMNKIVRCKDCRYYKPLDDDRPYDCHIGLSAVVGTDYCCFGVREREEKDYK